MASFELPAGYNYSGSSTLSLSPVPYYITTSSGSSGLTWTVPPAVVPPREPTVLEWLDAEVERTCARARA